MGAPQPDTHHHAPWLDAGDVKAAFARFRRDQMTDHAAALTYYAMLSLFPALLAGVAILGLVTGPHFTDSIVADLRQAGAQESVIKGIQGALSTAQGKQQTAVLGLVVGVLTALNGASGAFGASGRALNAVFRVQEGRGFVRRKLNDLGSTMLVLLAVIVTLVLMFAGGGIADSVLGSLGLGHTASTIWSIARWPAALASAMVVYALIYALAPNVRVRRFRWITPGAVLGVVLWTLASALFYVYATNFSSYGATYGTFAGAVILLFWLWLSNVALLFGAELNAAVDTRRTPEFRPGYDGPPLPVKEPAES